MNWIESVVELKIYIRLEEEFVHLFFVFPLQHNTT